MKNRLAFSIALATTLFAGSLAVAQLPGMPPPKHYPWSDASLSPDERADLVIKEMTWMRRSRCCTAWARISSVRLSRMAAQMARAPFLTWVMLLRLWSSNWQRMIMSAKCQSSTPNGNRVMFYDKAADSVEACSHGLHQSPLPDFVQRIFPITEFVIREVEMCIQNPRKKPCCLRIRPQ
jgi:hypothetical protein